GELHCGAAQTTRWASGVRAARWEPRECGDGPVEPLYDKRRMAIRAGAKQVLGAVQGAGVVEQPMGDVVVGHDVHCISKPLAIERKRESDYPLPAFLPMDGHVMASFRGHLAFSA